MVRAIPSTPKSAMAKAIPLTLRSAMGIMTLKVCSQKKGLA
jgi:hypothetical protein